MAPDGVRLRKSLRPDRGSLERLVKKNDKTVVPIGKLALHSRSRNWVRDCRLEGSRRFPSKMFPQIKTARKFLSIPTKSAAFQATNTAVTRARMSTTLNHVYSANEDEYIAATHPETNAMQQ